MALSQNNTSFWFATAHKEVLERKWVRDGRIFQYIQFFPSFLSTQSFSSQALFLPFLFQFHFCDENKVHVFTSIKISKIKPYSTIEFSWNYSKSKSSRKKKACFSHGTSKHEACSRVKLQRVKTFFPLSLAIEALFPLSLCWQLSWINWLTVGSKVVKVWLVSISGNFS